MLIAVQMIISPTCAISVEPEEDKLPGTSNPLLPPILPQSPTEFGWLGKPVTLPVVLLIAVPRPKYSALPVNRLSI